MTALADWTRQFDGDGLEAKTGISAVLATADEHGWPHLAYLSCGEILALAPDRLRVLLWPGSGTARHLKISRRASLHAAVGGIVCEARLEPVHLLADERSFMAELRVVETIKHRAPYARVTGMIGFELADPVATLERWRDQISRLRAFGS